MGAPGRAALSAVDESRLRCVGYLAVDHITGVCSETQMAVNNERAAEVLTRVMTKATR